MDNSLHVVPREKKQLPLFGYATARIDNRPNLTNTITVKRKPTHPPPYLAQRTFEFSNQTVSSGVFSLPRTLFL